MCGGSASCLNVTFLQLLSEVPVMCKSEQISRYVHSQEQHRIVRPSFHKCMFTQQGPTGVRGIVNKVGVSQDARLDPAFCQQQSWTDAGYGFAVE